VVEVQAAMSVAMQGLYVASHMIASRHLLVVLVATN
jgi:hypothetical protein